MPALGLGVLALAGSACFPAFDLPPGTPLPEGGLVSPAGVSLAIAGAPIDVELAAAPDLALVLSRSADGTCLLQAIGLEPVRALEPIVLPAGAARVRCFGRGTGAVVLTAQGLSLFHVSGRGLEPDGEVAFGDGGGGDGSGQGVALLAIDPARVMAYAISAGARSMAIVDLGARRAHSVPLPATARALAIAEGGGRAAVALEREETVLMLKPSSGSVLDRLPLPAPASALAFDDRGDRLLVALANAPVVEVIDAMKGTLVGEARAEVAAATPGPALAFDPVRQRLYTTNDRDHCVIVWDVAAETPPNVLGFVPAGYRPSAVAASAQRLLVLCESIPLAPGEEEGGHGDRGGASLQIVTAPGTKDLPIGTATVRRNVRR